MPPWVSFLLVVLGIFVAPYVIGIWLANALRMKEYGWKIALVLGSISVATMVAVLGWPPQYGPDLNGGVIMVYEVDSEKQKEGQTVDMAELAGSIRLRLDPSGIKEITVRPYGKQQVEIIVPKASSAGGDDETREEEARIRKIITDIGSLEFRIVANRRDTRHQSAIELGEQLPRAVDEVTNIDGEDIARFVPVSDDEVERFTKNTRDYLTRKGRDGKTTQVLVMIDPYNVTGEYLNTARPGYDERMRPSVNFTFNNVGAHYFNRLTSENLPDQVGDLHRDLGIILDGELFSAPFIQGVISNTGQITGSFTEEEVQHLCSVLNAGKLPAALRKEPISSHRTGPTLGRDTIEKGRIAMGISLMVVMVVMFSYYRFSGLVSCFVLISNLVLILGLMITFKAALTLAGIAGLVLGVGMAVDANVLIFERIREELDRGAALRMAIRNGFDRATTTIVDANLTTLITALVLYVIGTDSIKGFAITLILGLLMNMFTAVFCARVFFDIAERKRWITKLNMMRILNKTEIDFIRLSRMAMVGSVLMPRFSNGMPTGVTVGVSMFDADEMAVYVPDTHEHRVLVYSLPLVAVDGVEDEPVFSFGVFGEGVGEFVYPTDVAVMVDEDGVVEELLISEYGGNDRVSRYAVVRDGDGGVGLEWIGQIGTASETIDGSDGVVALSRPQSIGVWENDGVWELIILDSSHHRVGRVGMDGVGGELIVWYESDHDPDFAAMKFPYGVTVLDDGSALISEFGGNVVRRMDLATGMVIEMFGVGGRGDGELATPWSSTVVDGRLVILDSGNNRIQMVPFGGAVRVAGGVE